MIIARAGGMSGYGHLTHLRPPSVNSSATSWCAPHVFETLELFADWRNNANQRGYG